MKLSQKLSFFGLFLLLLFLSCVSAGETNIHVIDVGTGDAVLIETDGKYTLIDAGPDRNTTAKYLTSHNITDLFLFLVTSMDPGKIRGIEEVMNRTVVHDYRAIKTDLSYPSYTRVLDKIKNESIPYTFLEPGEIISIGEDTVIEVVNVTQPYPDMNDEVVLKLVTGEISMLFLSQNGAPKMDTDDSITILRVPDHGSKKAYNAGFIHRLKPEVAVISTGRGGKGPDKVAMMGLEAAGAEVFRTDIRGTIIISTDGEKYSTGSNRTSSAGGSISLISVIETRPPG